MHKLLTILCLALIGVLLLPGCSVTKVEYEQGDNGKVSYRLYRNSHWLKTEGEGMRGGMTSDGKFEFDLEGLKSSPSEEFNKSMQTYMGAIISAMQIAAAAYNPSASGASAAKSATAATPQTTVVNVQPAAETATATATDATAQKSESCADGSCTTGACTDGSCTP